MRKNHHLNSKRKDLDFTTFQAHDDSVLPKQSFEEEKKIIYN